MMNVYASRMKWKKEMAYVFFSKLYYIVNLQAFSSLEEKL